MELQRRSFLTGIIAAIAAPAIVHAQSIMPVKVAHWVRRESCRGVKTWESYPWTVTVDYDKIDPERIPFALDEDTIGYFDQPGLQIRSLYVPPSYDPTVEGHLGSTFTEAAPLVSGRVRRLSGYHLTDINAFDIHDLRTLTDINADAFKFVQPEDLLSGAGLGGRPRIVR